MAVAALIGYAVLLALAFGVRTVLHARRTGSTGWIRPPTRAGAVGDGLFALGAAGVAGAPALDLAGLLQPIEVADRVALNLTGALLLAAGAVVALVAQAEMGAGWRAGIDLSDRHALVVHGLFRVVRNPFYTGMIMASAGVALAVPNVTSLAGWLLVLAGCQIDVRMVEEPHLRAVHGREYAAYVRSTPRFVPKLLSPSPPSRVMA